MYTKKKKNGNAFGCRQGSALLIILLLFMVSLTKAQQKMGKIAGTVKTSDGEALAYASVLLADTRYGVMSNNEGAFSFEAPIGKYTLIVTYAGFTTKSLPVAIELNQLKDMGLITIEAASNELREVVVEDIQTNKFADKFTTSAARMPLGNLENPQVYSVIRKELMQEQIAIDYNSALASVPGAVVSNGVNDSGNDIKIRGFASQATFRNGLAMDSRTQTDIFNIERVEVLKGPSGTLFGGPMAQYGGVVNNVTKRPFESFRGEVSYTAGSFGLNRFTADVNSPLNKDRTALMRVNVFGHSENSFQDYGFLRNAGAAVSLAFKPNDKTTVRFDADLAMPTKNLNAYTRPTPGLTAKSIRDLGIDFKRSLSSDDIGTPRSTVNAMAEIERKLSDHWTSRTSYQHGQSGEKESIFFVTYFLDNDHIERRFRIFENFQIVTDNIQQNFTGDFKIGSIRNRMVFGLDYFSRTTNNQSMQPIFQIYDTVAIKDTRGWTPISKAGISAIRDEKGLPSTNDITGEKTYGAYFSDVVNFTDNLMAMLSLRVDRYARQATRTNGVVSNDGDKQTQFSPKLGLVYQPIKDKIALFGNYLNGFSNPTPSLNSTTQIYSYWKPEKANQWEGGVKLDLFDGKWSSTISYYNIEVKDKVRALGDGTSAQDGTQQSKGFEFDIIANPFTGFNMVAGYGYNDNTFTKDTEANEGKRAAWTPVHVANVWISYRLMNGTAKGLGVGFGGNYAGKTFFDVDEKFSVPAYTIFGATIFYDQPKYRVGLKCNNLTGERYWNFYGQPQKPTEVVANISYKF